jgi:hypothetical protein
MAVLASSIVAEPPVTLPRPRGPITERLFASLCQRPHALGWDVAPMELADEDDLHLALYCCYELHYQGMLGVDPEWEWEPSLLAIRRQLENHFLAKLEDAVEPEEVRPEAVIPRLWDMASTGTGPSLSAWVAEQANLDQLRELAVHRSAYQLKEADPHTWAIPRLSGAAKAAMVGIQADEYGNGVSGSMHATLFAETLAALGLNPAMNLYLDRIPGLTLATTNLITMFGLHRRWRGAIVGHLALFEMTSIGPMAHYAQAHRRLGVSESGCAFYDVHVTADQVHQHLAADGMVAGLLSLEPHLARDVLFGAACLDVVEGRFSSYILGQWQARRSSLLTPASTEQRVPIWVHYEPRRLTTCPETNRLAG